MESIGIYIHIPYCIQRCRYCDFTTFEQDKILPPADYVEKLKTEIRHRAHWAPFKTVHSIYFGGGTPSLLEASFIVSILNELNNAGFAKTKDCEVTIEINPATIDENNMNTYLKAGINRFSVGAQSFDDQLLQVCGRRHSAEDTRKTLKILNEFKANYSFDLLFALPDQSLDQLHRDLDEVNNWSPPHLSAYCLTVPEGHPMSFNRPSEDNQVKMFEVIEDRLKEINLLRYEISNFAKPGFESAHNMTYWNDQPYLSFGLSAHSYFPKGEASGLRFWNPKDFDSYFEQLEVPEQNWRDLPAAQRESLKPHEALTDFFHMHLRKINGLPSNALHLKFPQYQPAYKQPLENLLNTGHLIESEGHFRLSKSGLLVSNYVFSQLTFCEQDLH